MDDPDSRRGGVIRAPMALDFAQPWVDPRDIAEIAAVRLLGPAWSGRQIRAVHGPEDLTLAQVAAIISEAVGYPVRAEMISGEDWHESLRTAGFGEKQVDGISGMTGVTRVDFVPEDKRSYVTTTPTTMAVWANGYLRPALRAARPG